MEKELKDIEITCKDCGTKFMFTVRDQEFYAEKGFNNQPVRCKACRDKRKAERDNNRKFDNNNERY
ncbi:MAG: zinc-ribbon domain-containing protein [Bacilli bacterium]|jgi:DNA-directed RNA polymerase subunit RPC12/RpoP|nr:zinc-ribbon domain-containing protein [Bacilli bacterium]